MKTFRVLFLAVLASSSLAQGTLAQMGSRGGMMSPPSVQGVWSPIVGTGAAYEIQNKGQKQTMEMTIVGKEAVNGKDAYWLEYGIADPKSGGTMYMKMLMGQSESSVITERMIMQVPGQPQPIEMSMQFQASPMKKDQQADIRQKAELVGTETVTVPAGTFSCEHYKVRDGSGDVWVNAKVSPWGLVKFTGKDSTMVLLKTITDAKDHITGTPMKFDPMQMMRQGEKP